MNASLTDAIDALLPQTQCTKCGYAGCRPYAEAIAGGLADINQCPPGGARGIHELATLLGREAKPLNPANGVEQPRAVAIIDEARCIGCMLCTNTCPTDAILGAAKQMHTVLTPYCTGCELCLPPCPVDCIDMVAVSRLAEGGSDAAIALQEESVPQMAARARTRHRSRTLRLERDAAELASRLNSRARSGPGHRVAPAALPEDERKRAAVRAALERARARRAAGKP